MKNIQKILIVDDDPMSVEILEFLFSDKFLTRCVYSGTDALATLKTFTPDLMILDVTMPGLNGYEVCREIRKNPDLSGMKIIMVTGHAMQEDTLKGYQTGVNDYITKPFDLDSIEKKISYFLHA